MLNEASKPLSIIIKFSQEHEMLAKEYRIQERFSENNKKAQNSM